MKNFFSKMWKAIKEFFRKQLVKIKQAPNIIPLVGLVVALVVYTLGMTDVSNTTLTTNMRGMGLAAFAATLFSILVVVAYMNSYPRRAKVKIPMLVVSYAFVAIISACQAFYLYRIQEFIANPDTTLDAEKTASMLGAQKLIIAHLIILGICVLLMSLLPLYAKLLRKINTRVQLPDDDLSEIKLDLEEDV